MRFQYQQADDCAENARKRQDTEAERAHLRPITADERREGQDHRELCKLRRLKREAPYPKPAPGAVGLHADQRHQQQKQQRQPQEGKSPAPVKAHRQP